jgi:hypothetical protein
LGDDFMKKGLYCTIKFVPHPLREESINIGIILHCPEARFLDFKINYVEVKKKINRFAPKFDLNICNYLLEELITEIKNFRNDVSKVDILEKLKISFNQFVKIEKIKKYMVENPEEDINNLYKEMVSDKFFIPIPQKQKEALSKRMYQTIGDIELLYKKALEKSFTNRLNSLITTPAVNRMDLYFLETEEHQNLEYKYIDHFIKGFSGIANERLTSYTKKGIEFDEQLLQGYEEDHNPLKNELKIIKG